MQKFITYLYFFFAVTIAFASESAISIDSYRFVDPGSAKVRVGRFDPAPIIVEVSGVNKTNNKTICFLITAKSKSGVIQSPHSINIGSKQDKASGKYTSTYIIARPSGPESKTTDILSFSATLCSDRQQNIIVSKQFNQTIHWKRTVRRHTDIFTTPFQLFREKIVSVEFKTLDLLLKKWNTPKERNINGDWKLSEFISALKSSCNVGKREAKKTCFKRIEHWKTISPQTAGLAEAKYWMDSAWHVRGGRYATHVDPYAMKLFTKRMKKAELALKKIESTKANNPIWYELYLGIAIDTNREEKFITRLFNESIKKHQSYLPLYSAMVNYWGDFSGEKRNLKAVDNLINKATAVTFESDADANYARLYSELIYKQQRSESIFKGTFVSWPKMKKSFQSMVAEYPSPDNLNQFTFLACQADDKDAFLTLKLRIGKKIKPALWPNNYSIDLCQRKFVKEI